MKIASLDGRRWVMGLLVLGFSMVGVKGRTQVIMLPGPRAFSASTSVVVPDRGIVQLGSVNRAREASVTRGVPGLAQLPGVGGLFRNQAIGRDMSTSRAAVTATIIDLRELDRQVLAAAQVRYPSPEEIQREKQATFLMRNIARHEVSAPVRIHVRNTESASPVGVEEIRRQNQLAASERAREASHFLEKARELDAQGNVGVARIYYQMAARRTQGPMQQAIMVRLREINLKRGER